MIYTVVGIVAGSFIAAGLRDLFSARWGKLRHIDCLRQLLRAAGGFDSWDLRCENCGHRMRDADLYVAVMTHVRSDGSTTATGTVVVWHSKRPACAAAFAADPRAREIYAAEENGS